MIQSQLYEECAIEGPVDCGQVGSRGCVSSTWINVGYCNFATEFGLGFSLQS